MTNEDGKERGLESHPLGRRTLQLLEECCVALVHISEVIGRVVVKFPVKREREMEARFLVLIEQMAAAAMKLGERDETRKKRKKN